MARRVTPHPGRHHPAGRLSASASVLRFAPGSEARENHENHCTTAISPASTTAASATIKTRGSRSRLIMGPSMEQFPKVRTGALLVAVAKLGPRGIVLCVARSRRQIAEAATRLPARCRRLLFCQDFRSSNADVQIRHPVRPPRSMLIGGCWHFTPLVDDNSKLGPQAFGRRNLLVRPGHSLPWPNFLNWASQSSIVWEV